MPRKRGIVKKTIATFSHMRKDGIAIYKKLINKEITCKIKLNEKGQIQNCVWRGIKHHA